MVNVQINGVPLQVQKNSTILQACAVSGENVPSFCYHDRLNIAGNCRICLVQVEGIGKLVESCTVQVREGLKIFTKTAFVKKGRENVMEMMLFNHPLDCAICDQAGECDLQDQSKIYGGDRSRAFSARRGVMDKNCGPLIKTVMTRCIHCTRCVRFSEEIAQNSYFGSLKRGTFTEISFYKNKPFRSEISGNVIDLCPVGALTAKPYAFSLRPWEEKTYEINSFDFLDSTFPRVKLNFTETKIINIFPKQNNLINKEWISDYIRFSVDGLMYNQLFFKQKKEEDNWKSYIDSFDIQLKEKCKNGVFLSSFIYSDFVVNAHFFLLLNKVESLILDFNLKNFANKTSFSSFSLFQDCANSRFYKNSDLFGFRDFRYNYTTKYNLESLKQLDGFFFFNVPLKKEFPVMNSYIHIYQKNYNKNVLIFGDFFDPLRNNNFKHVGFSMMTLLKIFRGKSKNSLFFVKNKNIGLFYDSKEASTFYKLFSYFDIFFVKFFGKKKNMKINLLSSSSNMVVKNEYLFKISSLNQEYSYKLFKKNEKKKNKNALLFFFFNVINSKFHTEFTDVISICNATEESVDGVYHFPLSTFFEHRNVESINSFSMISQSQGLSNLNDHSDFTETFYLYKLFDFFTKKRNNNNEVSFDSDHLSNDFVLNNHFIIRTPKLLPLYYTSFDATALFTINKTKNILLTNAILSRSSALKYSANIEMKLPFYF